MNDFLAKPFVFETLQQRIRDFVDIPPCRGFRMSNAPRDARPAKIRLLRLSLAFFPCSFCSGGSRSLGSAP